MAIRVLLAERHRMIRDAFRSVLHASGEFQVVGEAGDGFAIIELWRELRPGVLLMAVHLDGLNGIDAAIEILKESPSERIVLLAPDSADPLLLCAARCGARGLVVEQSPADELLMAMRVVASGEFYVNVLPRQGVDPGGLKSIDALSPREQEVLRLVSNGKSSKEIAVTLRLGVETVRSYRKSMMKKLNVTNAAKATRAAITGGLTTAQTRGPLA